MKALPLFFAISSALILIACSNNAIKNEHEGHDMAAMNSDSTKHVANADNRAIREIAVTYSQIDPRATSTIKVIVDQYLLVKNALVSNNSEEAANGANAMTKVLKDFDKSLLTTDQENRFAALESNLKLNAEQISKNASNITAQRLQFADMSQAIYELVRAFGAGRTVYHDHCPMARDNQGAMWISEMKDVKNPYFGAEMLTCGTVEEIIK